MFRVKFPAMLMPINFDLEVDREIGFDLTFEAAQDLFPRQCDRVVIDVDGIRRTGTIKSLTVREANGEALYDVVVELDAEPAQKTQAKLNKTKGRFKAKPKPARPCQS